MPDTHCLPSGSLGTGELPVPNIGSANCTTMIPSGGLGHGNVRGIVVYCHGIIDFVAQVPHPTDFFTTPGLESEILPFANAVVADGWIFLCPSYQEDFYVSPACLGIQNDIVNDAGNGSRYLNSTLRWWDHVVEYCQQLVAANVPIVCFGVSWGGWRAIQLAKNKQSTMIGYVIHVPLTILSNLKEQFATPANFNLLNTSGLDLTGSDLNAVAIPGIVGYGTNDEAVGYSGIGLVAVTSNGQNVTALGGGLLNIQGSSTPFVPGAAVLLTGLSGGSSGGRAEVAFTGVGTNQLTGCTCLSGTGTLATGNPVTQSRTSQIITNATGASQPVTANSTADFHEFTATDATTYANYVASTLDPLAPKQF